MISLLDLKRIAIFAHFDRDNLVDNYILYYLEQLRSVSQHIIFVTTSQIDQADIAKLNKICDTIIVRENIGYDFASWRTGLSSISNLVDYDELILCNDSVYGPLFPMENAFVKMQEKLCDFWGMTDNYEIAYHLQSYFLVFKKNVINSKAFTDFWNSLETNKPKQDIIRDYEVGLSQSLRTVGFKPCAYASHKASLIRLAILRLRKPSRIFRTLFIKNPGITNINLNLNQTHFFWKELIVKHKLPFIKIELLRDNPAQVDINNYENIIKKYSYYDVSMIRYNLNRTKRRGSSLEPVK